MSSYWSAVCDDCISYMQTLETGSIDMLFTDLPYGTTKCRWDTPIDLEKFWEQARRITKLNGAILLFAQTPFDKVLGCSNIKELRYEWIWEKTEATGHLNANRMPMKAHENILVFYRKLPAYHPQKITGQKRKISTAEHKVGCKKSDCYGEYGLTSYDSTERFPRSVIKGPTDKQKEKGVAVKPVWLCEKMVRMYTEAEQTVLDCCMGTGSIGVACILSRRRYIGIEIEKSRFDRAVERMCECERGLQKVL